MCGIVGVLSTEFNTFNHPYGKFFKQALFADTLRGADSTGIMLMEGRKDRPEVYKKAMAGYDFLQLNRTHQLLKDAEDYNMMIGHNRAATKGGISHHTAHPFQLGDITLVHNGTVNNHRTLKQGHQFNVDSEAICNSIDEDGAEETIEKLDGAFTLIWHDHSDGSVNFVRNDERPLAFGKVKDKDTILLSSEASMLRWLAVRTGLSLESVIEPKPGELFSFWPYKDNKGWIESAVNRTVKLKPKYTPPQHNYGGRHNSHGNGGKKGGNNSGNGGNGSATVTNILPGNNLTSEARVILKNLDLEKGEAVTMGSLQWQPYVTSKDKNMGRLVGKLEDIAYTHAAVFHGVEKDRFEREFKGKYIYSDIESASWSNANIREIFLDNQDFVIFDEGELPLTGNVDTVDYEGDDTPDEPNDTNAGGGTKALAAITFRGPKGDLISHAEWEEATKEGCAVCVGNVWEVDHEKTGWTPEGQPVCKQCIKEQDRGDLLH